MMMTTTTTTGEACAARLMTVKSSRLSLFAFVCLLVAILPVASRSLPLDSNPSDSDIERDSAFSTEDRSLRTLTQSKHKAECAVDNGLLGTIYYKFYVYLNLADSTVVNRCSPRQLQRVRDVIAGAIRRMNLEQTYRNIKEVKNHVCRDVGLGTNRRLIGQSSEEEELQEEENDAMAARELAWGVSSKYLVSDETLRGITIGLSQAMCWMMTVRDECHRLAP